MIVSAKHDIQLVFERKTIRDLAASIKDGRYKEQKCRLLSNFPPNRITYIIEEGHIVPKDICGLRKSVFSGMYINTLYRDGIHVVFTKGTLDTAQFILDVATKCKSNPEYFVSTPGPVGKEGEEYVESRKAKSRKIENIDADACYKLQLCQIPGISFKLADSIMERYPSLASLIQHLLSFETKSAAIKSIESIQLFGKKKATTFVEYLRPELQE